MLGRYDPADLQAQGRRPTWTLETEGTDILRGVEFVEFEGDGQRVPLTRWHFDVTRYDNGKARVTLKEFGPDGVETLWSRKASYDDATPIAKGLYEAALRTNSANGTVIELMDQATGASTTPGRSAIQLHAGASTQNSDGCVVLRNWSKLLQPITDALAGMNDHDAGGRITKRLPDGGISVRFANDIDQPTLATKTRDGKNGAGVVAFRIDDGADDRITKWIKLTYEVSGDVEVSALRGIKPGSLKQSGDRLEFMIEAGVRAARLKIVSDDPTLADPVDFDLDLQGVNFYRQNGSKKQAQEPWQMRNLLLDGDRDAIDFQVDIWD